MNKKMTWQKKLRSVEKEQVFQLLESIHKDRNIYYKLDLHFTDEEKSYVEHFLYWEDHELKGYGWSTSFDEGTLEITLILPEVQEIFDQIFQEIKQHSKDKNINELLFISDEKNQFLNDNLKRNQGMLLFSEYYMMFRQAKYKTNDDLTDVSLVKPQSADLEELEYLLEGKPLDEDLAHTLLYKIDGKLAACIRLEEAEGCWGLYGFVVDESQRGKGIGRKVLKTVLKTIAKQNPAEIYLEVETENQPAYHLYLSEGFEVRNTYNYYAVK